jgi:L-ascorbate metabolism protein UlaG (beta-lactamase superfamily)
MQVVTVASQTLFQVALTYLGDATQWIRIATLNGISDPWLSGLVTLTIPDQDPSAGGGVAGQ